jgi:hypothetical protein
MTESFFTSIYISNKWGSKETPSGPSSTLAKTETLRSHLPQLFSELNIHSILDCGCGDFHWFQNIQLESIIQYLGVDIVEPLIVQNQAKYTNSTLRFQKMNLLEEPPETADLWILRDVTPLLSYEDCKKLLQKFIESKSKYLAITSIEKEEENMDGTLGTWRALDLRKAPFQFPEPIQKLKHKLDYEHYMDKQIKPIAKTILETLGIDFEELIFPEFQQSPMFFCKFSKDSATKI